MLNLKLVSGRAINHQRQGCLQSRKFQLCKTLDAKGVLWKGDYNGNNQSQQKQGVFRTEKHYELMQKLEGFSAIPRNDES